jgi:hypothetical protein
LYCFRQTSASRTSQHTAYQTKPTQSINQYNNSTNRTPDRTNHQNISHLYKNGNDIDHENTRYTESMHTVNSLHNVTANTINSANNGTQKSGKINTSSLITRLEMMKSDFLLMEQKYC